MLHHSVSFSNRHGHTAFASSLLAGSRLVCADWQVEVEIDLNAAANARNLYANRKANLVKQQKTLDANEKAFKAAEKKATLSLNKVK